MGELPKYQFDAIDFGTGRTRSEKQAEQKAQDDKTAAEAEAAAAEAEKNALRYTQTDLDDARAMGLVEGRDAAMQELLEGEQRRTTEMMQQISQQLGALMTAQDSHNQKRDRAALSALIAMGKKIFPVLSAAGSLDEIERLVADRMPDLIDEPRLVLRIHEDQLDLIRPRLENLADQQGFNGRVIFIGDTDLQPGDCRLEWADGGAERHAHEMWAEFEQVARRLLGPDNRPAEQTTMAAQNAPDEG
ncbi:MAG: hypothetical protein Alpg2KO_20480 [Alphaproteobacteria bacterium]